MENCIHEQYRFARGDKVEIIGGYYAPMTGYVVRIQGKGFVVSEHSPEDKGLTFFVLAHEIRKVQ